MRRTKNLVAIVLIACCALLSGCGIHFGTVTGMLYQYDNAQLYTAGPVECTGDVKNIELHWISGEIDIQTHDGNTISVSETANRDLKPEEVMRWYLDGDTLRVQFGQSGGMRFVNLTKRLTVYLPEELELDALWVDSVSAGATLNAVRAENLRMDSVSGDLKLEDVTIARSLEIETTSGSIKGNLLGELKSLEIDTTSGTTDISAEGIGTFYVDTTSGGVTLRLRKAPDSGKVDTVSGSVALYLPQDSGFTARFDSVSGRFLSDIATTQRLGTFTAGNGESRLDFDTTSGSVRIRILE